MNSFTINISAELMKIVQQRYTNDYSNIREVKLFWHNLTYLMFSYAHLHRLKKKKDSLNFKELFELGIIPLSLFEFQKENAELLDQRFESIAELLAKENCNLSAIRESLLNEDLKVTKESIDINHGKIARDITGSYYTSSELAYGIVEKSFESFSTKGKFESAYQMKIADLSCGGGEFIWATQEFLKTHYNISLEESALYFWGMDVDPIALQITLCELLNRANVLDWENIISHFRLGNPLVSTDKEGDFDCKNNLFALNRIYASQMGCDFTAEDEFKNFDIILGNPPWEKIRFEERKFFTCYEPNISKLSKKDERKRAIEKLKIDWPDLFDWVSDISSDYSVMCSNCYRHPLIKDSAVGELNTYALFAELSYSLLSENGFSSLIVKSTLATTPAHKGLWTRFLSNGSVRSLYFFDNRKRIFNIDSRERFAVICFSKTSTDRFLFAAGLQSADDLLECNAIHITADDVLAINPFTNMLPNITNTEDIKVLMDIHQKMPLFGNVYPNCHFGRLIHLTAHADQITTELLDDTIPIYEGKFLEQYDARFSTFEGVTKEKRYTSKASAVKSSQQGTYKAFPESRYFVNKSLWEKYTRQYNQSYSLCWRSLTSPTNARTMIAMILPTCPTCQSIQMLQTESNDELIMLLGLFNSLPFDYFVRLKMPGIDLTQSVIKQIPVPSEERYDICCNFYGHTTALRKHILSSICYLLKDEELLHDLIESLKPLVYRISEKNSKATVKKTLDRMFALAYQMDENDLLRIASTFPKY